MTLINKCIRYVVQVLSGLKNDKYRALDGLDFESVMSHPPCSMYTIINPIEKQRVADILNDSFCDHQLRRNIMAYYDPKTGRFFMRYFDLIEFEQALKSKKIDSDLK